MLDQQVVNAVMGWTIIAFMVSAIVVMLTATFGLVAMVIHGIRSGKH